MDYQFMLFLSAMGGPQLARTLLDVVCCQYTRPSSHGLHLRGCYVHSLLRLYNVSHNLLLWKIQQVSFWLNLNVFTTRFCLVTKVKPTVYIYKLFVFTVGLNISSILEIEL